MKRNKYILKGRKVYLKRVLAAAMLIVFACFALSCAAETAGESPKIEAEHSEAENSAPRSETAAAPEPSSQIIETAVPEPEESEDPYSYEELTKDIPEDYWDRFLPEIEEIKYKSNEGEEEWPFEYKGGVLALWRDVEFNPDDFEYNLRYGKQTSYQSIFENTLPLNSPVGYYLVGLENENPIIKLYCITQLSKYVYTNYEEACIEALNKVIGDMTGDDTEEGRIILDQARKYKNFLEHKFDYNSEVFDDDYIWVSEENTEGKRYIIWSYGMIPNIVSKYVEDSLWAYDGETVWEIDAEPHFEFNGFVDADNAHLGEHFGISAFYQFDLPFDGQWEEHLLNGDLITVQNSQGPEYSDIGYDEILVRKVYGKESSGDTILADTDSAYQIILFGDKFNMDMSKSEFFDSVSSLSESCGLEPYELNIVNGTGNFVPATGINDDIVDFYFKGDAELSNGNYIYFELPALFGEEPIIDIYTAPDRSILSASPHFDNDKLIRYTVWVLSDEDNQDEFNFLVKGIYRELEKEYDRIDSSDDIKDGDLLYKYLADSTESYNLAWNTNLSVQEYYNTIYGYERFPGYSRSINIDLSYDYTDFFIGDDMLIVVSLSGPTEYTRNHLTITYYSSYDIDKIYSEEYNRLNTGNTETVPQSASPSFDENGFVFADSSSRLLTPEELAPLSKEMLGFARNEIFARHGDLFETPKYIQHYYQYEWYYNLPKIEDVGYPDLNDIEIANVELIKQFENN